jgi:hypothetical protein
VRAKGETSLELALGTLFGRQIVPLAACDMSTRLRDIVRAHLADLEKPT